MGIIKKSLVAMAVSMALVAVPAGAALAVDEPVPDNTSYFSLFGNYNDPPVPPVKNAVADLTLVLGDVDGIASVNVTLTGDSTVTGGSQPGLVEGLNVVAGSPQEVTLTLTASSKTKITFTVTDLLGNVHTSSVTIENKIAQFNRKHF